MVSDISVASDPFPAVFSFPVDQDMLEGIDVGGQSLFAYSSRTRLLTDTAGLVVHPTKGTRGVCRNPQTGRLITFEFAGTGGKIQNAYFPAQCFTHDYLCIVGQKVRLVRLAEGRMSYGEQSPLRADFYNSTIRYYGLQPYESRGTIVKTYPELWLVKVAFPHGVMELPQFCFATDN